MKTNFGPSSDWLTFTAESADSELVLINSYDFIRTFSKIRRLNQNKTDDFDFNRILKSDILGLGRKNSARDKLSWIFNLVGRTFNLAYSKQNLISYGFHRGNIYGTIRVVT